jgi:ATP-dependent DNA ligase
VWSRGNMNVNRVQSGLLGPMLSLAVAKLPEGPEWTYELKIDGYRALGLASPSSRTLLMRIFCQAPERFPGSYRLSRRFATTPSRRCSRTASMTWAADASKVSE